MWTEIFGRAQAFVERKYAARADARQKAMGLAYVEAERVDLAREMANFAAAEVERATHVECGENEHN